MDITGEVFMEKKRFPLLDSIRGTVLISMILYHATWNFVYIYMAWSGAGIGVGQPIYGSRVFVGRLSYYLVFVFPWENAI